jgi:signal transduction histidine kinase
VLINLIDNAIKYSAPEQPVDLVLEKTAQSAIIHVRDRGIGISLSHQKRIFERFYRVDLEPVLEMVRDWVWRSLKA